MLNHKVHSPIPIDPEPVLIRFLYWLTDIYNYVFNHTAVPVFSGVCTVYSKLRLRWILPIVALVTIAWFAAFIYMAVEVWPRIIVVTTHPINVIRTAKAAEDEKVWPDIGDCEQYREAVQKYFGKLTDEALFVAKHESGCVADRISDPNKDGSRDFCLFQINKEKLAAQSLEVCVRRAFEKYMNGRIGKKNWSDFYAVCKRNKLPDGTEGTPIPKYPKVINNCS